MKTLRIASYNIHKGVRGVGLARRLEIHNLGHAVEQFDADLICLQEVRAVHRRQALHFHHWPALPQADFLAPLGYEAAYRTNALTRHGEHGNAVLSRWPVQAVAYEDMSDHALEQRGLLHVRVQVGSQAVHVLVVHLGLVRSSRRRQLAQLTRYAEREISPDAPLVVAGDFNDTATFVAQALQPLGLQACVQPVRTFPSRLPLVQLDHVLARHLPPVCQSVPNGRVWTRMSDHLPLLAEFGWPPAP